MKVERPIVPRTDQRSRGQASAAPGQATSAARALGRQLERARAPGPGASRRSARQRPSSVGLDAADPDDPRRGRACSRAIASE